MKFYANESDYESALLEAARNTCGNCGEVVADLFTVHESATPYRACAECYAEVDAMFEREAAGTPNPADRQVLAAMRRNDSAGITGGDARAMLDRAQAGFLAGRTERRVVYQRLRNVIESALGLHQFLVANADKIEYDPAAGGASRDPVLEAVPATPELGQEMWAEVDKITASLDALGALDKVTTDRLLDLVTARLREIAIR